MWFIYLPLLLILVLSVSNQLTITSNNGLMMGIIISLIIAAFFFYVFLMSHWSNDYHTSLLDQKFRQAGGNALTPPYYEYFCGGKCQDLP